MGTALQLLVDALDVSHELLDLLGTGHVLDPLNRPLHLPDAKEQLIRVEEPQHLLRFGPRLRLLDEVLLVGQFPDLVVSAATLHTVSGHLALPRVQFGLELLLVLRAGRLVLRLHFFGFLVDVLPEDFGHARVHPVDGLATGLLLLGHLFSLSLAFAVNLPLQLGSAHLVHLSLLFFPDRRLEIVEFLVVLIP